MTFLPPQYNARLTATPQQDRLFMDTAVNGAFVRGYADLKVSAGTGLASSVAIGSATVRNSFQASGGLYHVTNATSAVTVTHSTPDATNPRIDLVYLKVFDSTDGGDSSDGAQLGILAGTPTASAAITNVIASGAPTLSSLPTNSIPLAYALVPAAAGSASAFTYRDARPLGRGILPDPKTATGSSSGSALTLRPLFECVLQTVTTNSGHVVGLFELGRAITATFIRFTYQQGATPSTSAYNLGIYNTAGILLAQTSNPIYTGSAASIQIAKVPISAVFLEAGQYYIGFASAGSTVRVYGYASTSIASPRTAFSSGNTTIVPDIAAFLTDLAGAAPTVPNIPIIQLCAS